MERSHSGLVHRLGKAAYPKGYREFKSRPLRIDSFVLSCFNLCRHYYII